MKFTLILLTLALTTCFGLKSSVNFYMEIMAATTGLTIDSEFKGNLSIPAEFGPPLAIFPFYGICTTHIFGRFMDERPLDGSITVAYADLMNIYNLGFVSTNITTGFPDGGPSGDDFEYKTIAMNITVPRSPSSTYTFSTTEEIEETQLSIWGEIENPESPISFLKNKIKKN